MTDEEYTEAQKDYNFGLTALREAVNVLLNCGVSFSEIMTLLKSIQIEYNICLRSLKIADPEERVD
jgi:hypothetical protein